MKQRQENNLKLVENLSNFTSKLPIEKENDIMSEKKYVTKSELEHIEEKIDLKIENTETKISGEIKNMQTEINGNFYKMKSDIEILLLKKSEEEKKERKKENRETIRTILTGFSVIISVSTLLIKVIFGL